MTNREIREAAGWSRDRAAAAAQVSHHTARAFELDPDSIRDKKRRQRLATVYAQLRRQVEAAALQSGETAQPETP